MAEYRTEKFELRWLYDARGGKIIVEKPKPKVGFAAPAPKKEK
jgi:hypothetical protein